VIENLGIKIRSDRISASQSQITMQAADGQFTSAQRERPGSARSRFQIAAVNQIECPDLGFPLRRVDVYLYVANAA